MKVSPDGKMEDAQIEEGKRIVEEIYAILYSEWLPVMREAFDSEQLHNYSIGILWCLLLGNPTKKELTEFLYDNEIEKFNLVPSLSRCEIIAEKLMLLKPRVDASANYTDDPNLQ